MAGRLTCHRVGREPGRSSNRSSASPFAEQAHLHPARGETCATARLGVVTMRRLPCGSACSGRDGGERPDVVQHDQQLRVLGKEAAHCGRLEDGELVQVLAKLEEAVAKPAQRRSTAWACFHRSEIRAQILRDHTVGVLRSNSNANSRASVVLPTPGAPWTARLAALPVIAAVPMVRTRSSPAPSRRARDRVASSTGGDGLVQRRSRFWMKTSSTTSAVPPVSACAEKAYCRRMHHGGIVPGTGQISEARTGVARCSRRSSSRRSARRCCIVGSVFGRRLLDQRHRSPAVPRRAATGRAAARRPRSAGWLLLLWTNSRVAWNHSLWRCCCSGGMDMVRVSV